MHRNFIIVSARAGWILVDHLAVSAVYYAETAPIAVSTNNPMAYERQPCSDDPFGTCYILVPKGGTVYAAGLSPIGLRLSIKAFPKLRVVFDGSGGMLVFTREVPNPQGRRLNYVSSVGGGIDIQLSRKVAGTLSYLWHHTSNGGSAKSNPGLDSRMIRIGLMRLR
jgi:hypothetical protein